jgi:hypothetical protein
MSYFLRDMNLLCIATPLVPGFRIRIDLMRIRIQHFFLIAHSDLDPDPGLLFEFNCNFFREFFKVIFFLLSVFLLS